MNEFGLLARFFLGFNSIPWNRVNVYNSKRKIISQIDSFIERYDERYVSSKGEAANKTVATSLFGDRSIERSQLGSPRQTFWPVAPYLPAAALFTFSSRSGLTDFGRTPRTRARHERSFFVEPRTRACAHGIVAPPPRSSRDITKI